MVVRYTDDRVRSVGQEGKRLSAQIQVMLSDSILFQRTLAGEQAFSDPFLVEGTEELAMVVSIPILSDTGQALGALFLQVNMEKIQGMTEIADQEAPGTIFVVDSDGRLMGHTERDRVLRREDMTDLDIVNDFLTSKVASLTQSYENKDGELVRGSYASVGNSNWGVVSERSQVKAFSSINEIIEHSDFTINRLTLATIIGVISTAILATAIGAFLAFRISSPIHAMREGVIAIADKDYSQRFLVRGPTDIQRLASTLNDMSEAIEKYTRDLEKQARDLEKQAKDMHSLFKGSVQSLAATIDAKDPYTKGHSSRVTLISTTIGSDLNLNKQQMEELEIAALMHDIGKIGIDDAVLKKPGLVTDEERTILQEHPSLGASIMEPIPLLKNMIPGMLHHHERWDGTGYPMGLKKDNISLYGRIIAVADTFDAMTSDRPYQKALPYEVARDMIVSWKGTRYDPLIVDSFLKTFPVVCRNILEVGV